MFWKKALEKQRAKRCLGEKPCKNNARNDVLGKSLAKTTHETMSWRKALEKQRAKRCFGKKSCKNNARNDVLEKSLAKTTRETVFRF